MLYEYLVTIKSKPYKKYFNNFLKCHNISYEFLNDTGVYIIKTTEYCASYIKNFPYVKDIAKDKLIPIDDEPKPVPIEPEDEGSSGSNCEFNWGINKIQVQNLWNKGFTGRGVRVAVLDSGVSKNSQLLLEGSISLLDNDKSTEDALNHGTLVCGIIGANKNLGPVYGVSYDCDLYSVKIIDNKGEVEVEAVVKALEWCIDNNIQVVNMSFGFEDLNILNPAGLDVLRQSISRAHAKGLILVASSGNNNKSSLYYPAAFDEVISCGAIDQNNTRWNNQNLGSNYGVGLNYMAPGVNIVSTANNGGYACSTGTSSAVPFLTGLIALLLNENPQRKYNDIIKILNDNVIALPEGNPNPHQYGRGLIQAPK